MTISEISSHLENFAEENLTPSSNERSFISDRYNEVSEILGGQCFQSGSYARHTSLDPVNDLDIIWRFSKSDVEKIKNAVNRKSILESTAEKLRAAYKKNGKKYRIKVQSHSIGIYTGKTDEEFSLDVVPAIESDLNEYGEPTYLVPEIIRLKKSARSERYASGMEINWIKSDPSGYIKQAELVHDFSPSFRKVVKLVKEWKEGCKNNWNDFPLKSFHLELVITDIFKKTPEISSFESIFTFFKTLSEIIKTPSFPDKANSSQYVDDYVSDISDFNKNRVSLFTETASQILEEIGSANGSEIETLIFKLLSGIGSVTRDGNESFLFDQGVLTCLDPNYSLIIDGLVSNDGGNSGYYLSKNKWQTSQNKEIYFSILDNNLPLGTTFKWKVKNSGEYVRTVEALRGEITEKQTRNKPESTQYIGHHYVECYAIYNGVCFTKKRISVIILNG